MFLSSFIVLITLFNGAIATITYPDLLTGLVGQDIDFKINSSNPILAIKFGIDGRNGLTSPLFITLKTLLDGVQCSDDLNTTAARYKGRVHFVGDIAKRFAWIRITNLTKDDSMVYRISVRENQTTSEDYESKTIKLLVKDKEAVPTVPTTPTQGKQKPTSSHKLTHKIAIPSKLQPFSPTSPSRFRYFEGGAEKIIIKEKSFRLEKEERKFAKAVENVYRNGFLYLSDLKITVSKMNRTAEVHFLMTFNQTVSLDSAFSILKIAQKRNQLEGYNITFLAITATPSTLRPYSSTSPGQNGSLPSNTLLYWVSVTLSVAAFLVLVLVCVKYRIKIWEYMKNCCLSNGADRNNDLQLENR